jgi:transcriptional regulator with XRE-family HTH domain
MRWNDWSRSSECASGVTKKVPNPTDQYVGGRVRMRRLMLDMTQEKLGHALGLTFQQVQKYEKGTNRIGASRLQHIAHLLQVPVSFFFDGAPTLPGAPAATGAAPSPSGPCLSACTMVLGVIPRDRLCVTPRARLGFHAAWRLNEAGRQVTSPDGTELLMSAYPQPVRDWIARRGGLSPRLMYLTGNELASMYPVCKQGQNVAAGGDSGPKRVPSDPSTSAFALGDKSPRRRFHP